MAKKRTKARNVHVDKYSAEAAPHKAELVRNQAEWEKQRLDTPNPVAKKKQSRRSDQPIAITD